MKKNPPGRWATPPRHLAIIPSIITLTKEAITLGVKGDKSTYFNRLLRMGKWVLRFGLVLAVAMSLSSYMFKSCNPYLSLIRTVDTNSFRVYVYYSPSTSVGTFDGKLIYAKRKGNLFARDKLLYVTEQLWIDYFAIIELNPNVIEINAIDNGNKLDKYSCVIDLSHYGGSCRFNKREPFKQIMDRPKELKGKKFNSLLQDTFVLIAMDVFRRHQVEFARIFCLSENY